MNTKNDEAVGPAVFLRGITLKEFTPVALYHKEMDMLMYLERDCSYRMEHVPGSNIEILRDAHTEQIVGVQIPYFSKVADFAFDGKLEQKK